MSSAIPGLDEVIHAFRVATQRPAYRQRLLAGLGFEGGIASLRLLRSVERLTDGDRGPAIRQVANDLGIEHSTASRGVETLVQAELLTRTRCADDQRQARLQLTPRGRDALAEATEHRQQVLAGLVEDWSEEDLQRLTVLLDRLRGSFDEEFGRR